jgi:hypothetical protein
MKRQKVLLEFGKKVFKFRLKGFLELQSVFKN